MAVLEIHVDDVGTSLQIKVTEFKKDPVTGVKRDVGVDLSVATALAIHVRKPDASTFSRAATSLVLVDSTDPDDGVECLMEIFSLAGEFDVPGLYSYQGEITFTSFGPFRTPLLPFKVHGNI